MCINSSSTHTCGHTVARFWACKNRGSSGCKRQRQASSKVSRVHGDCGTCQKAAVAGKKRDEGAMMKVEQEASQVALAVPNGDFTILAEAPSVPCSTGSAITIAEPRPVDQKIPLEATHFWSQKSPSDWKKAEDEMHWDTAWEGLARAVMGLKLKESPTHKGSSIFEGYRLPAMSSNARSSV
jgi:hypothetical protein